MLTIWKITWIFLNYGVNLLASGASKIIPRATTGLQKCGPGWVGPLKNSGSWAKFRVGLWPNPTLMMCAWALALALPQKSGLGPSKNPRLWVRVLPGLGLWSITMTSGKNNNSEISVVHLGGCEIESQDK